MTELVRMVLGGIAPDWLIALIAGVLTVTAILVVAPLTMMLQVWFERRVVARMQDRLGPNRVGPAGLFQSVADGVKMFTKEDITPRAADRWVHLLAPVIATAPVMLMMAVVPWARGMNPSNINIALLFVVAVTSVSAVGLMMAGIGSSNKFALLGAMRAVAQMVSYEIPAILSLTAVILLTGTLSLNGMIEAQAGLPVIGMLAGLDLGLGWFVFTPVGLLGFIIFFICVLSEGERTPFDIPEADSEIVAGYMTEYSGMKFALFFLAQFVLNFALSMVASAVFLGGWQGPGVAQLAAIGGTPGNVLAGALSLLYTLLKAWGLFFVMIWLRGAFPRLRVDQLMAFAWKFLLPLSLINILSAALWVVLTQWGAAQGSILGVLEGLPAAVRVVLAFVVTLAINAGSYVWMVRLNSRSSEPALVAVAQEARA